MTLPTVISPATEMTPSTAHALIVGQFGQGFEPVVDPNANGLVELIVFALCVVLGLGAAITLFVASKKETQTRAGLALTVAVAGLFGLSQSGYLSVVWLLIGALVVFVVRTVGAGRAQSSSGSSTPTVSRNEVIAGAVGAVLLTGVLGVTVAGPFLRPDASCSHLQAVADLQQDLGSAALPCRGLEAANAATAGGNVDLVGRQLFAVHTWSTVLLGVGVVGAGTAVMALGRRPATAEEQEVVS